MTNEDFNTIKWRLVGHLSMPCIHYSTYEGEYNGITITRQAANRVLKHGGYGKTRVAYLIGQRVFKSEKQLIKYLDEYESKNRT